MYGDDLHAFALQNIARCLGWVLSLDQFITKVESRRAAPPGLPAKRPR
jgi:hypothetical protein